MMVRLGTPPPQPGHRLPGLPVGGHNTDKKGATAMATVPTESPTRPFYLAGLALGHRIIQSWAGLDVKEYAEALAGQPITTDDQAEAVVEGASHVLIGKLRRELGAE